MTAIQRKRAECEAERAALITRLDAVDAKLALLAELEADPGGGPAAPKDAPVPPPGKPRSGPARDPTDAPAPSERAAVLLRLLALNPDGLRVSELVDSTGWDLSVVRHALRNSDLFEKADPSYLRSPWVLTEQGERAAGGGATSTTPPPATPAPAT